MSFNLCLNCIGLGSVDGWWKNLIKCGMDKVIGMGIRITRYERVYTRENGYLKHSELKYRNSIKSNENCMYSKSEIEIEIRSHKLIVIVLHLKAPSWAILTIEWILYELRVKKGNNKMEKVLVAFRSTPLFHCTKEKPLWIQKKSSNDCQNVRH